MKKWLDLIRQKSAPLKAANSNKGKVWLVGAGPGSADMLTVKAIKLLQAADILMIDALVSREVLDFIGPHTRIVESGKRCGKRSKSQLFINKQMQHFAEKGLQVVRLKAGDPFVFGRGGEEQDYLQSQGIEVSVVPGVSAAMAAACDAGQSLTYRGSHRQTTLMTGAAQDEFLGDSGPDWQSLTKRGSVTLYMPRHQLDLQLADMKKAGLSDALPITMVADAGSSDPQVVTTRLGDLKQDIALMREDSPVILLLNPHQSRQSLEITPDIKPDSTMPARHSA